MAPPRTVVTTSSCSLLLIYRPRKDERPSWPGWLTYSGRFIHISGHPSAVGRAQDTEGSPVKDQRSTAKPRNRPTHEVYDISESATYTSKSSTLRVVAARTASKCCNIDLTDSTFFVDAEDRVSTSTSWSTRRGVCITSSYVVPLPSPNHLSV